MRKRVLAAAVPAFMMLVLLRTDAGALKRHRSLAVTATAYNSVPAQTWGDPRVGAWGDRLDRLPRGVRAIAVSPDLLRQHGLKHRQRVRISGLKGEFVVLDKMPPRWQRRIDIHMGQDLRSARRWGRQPVTLSWVAPTAAGNERKDS